MYDYRSIEKAGSKSLKQRILLIYCLFKFFQSYQTIMVKDAADKSCVFPLLQTNKQKPKSPSLPSCSL